MKRPMRKTNLRADSADNRGKSETSSRLSSLKQEIVQSIYLGEGNMETLKAKFPWREQNSTVASLIYILEAESMITTVNGEYTLTPKAVRLLKEGSMDK